MLVRSASTHASTRSTQAVPSLNHLNGLSGPRLKLVPLLLNQRYQFQHRLGPPAALSEAMSEWAACMFNQINIDATVGANERKPGP